MEKVDNLIKDVEDVIGEGNYDALLKKHIQFIRIHNSTNEAIERLEKENIELREKNVLLKEEQVQWNQEKINQDIIIEKAINDSNNVIKQYAEEIQILKGEIKILKGN